MINSTDFGLKSKSPIASSRRSVSTTVTSSSISTTPAQTKLVPTSVVDTVHHICANQKVYCHKHQKHVQQAFVYSPPPQTSFSTPQSPIKQQRNSITQITRTSPLKHHHNPNCPYYTGPSKHLTATSSSVHFHKCANKSCIKQDSCHSQSHNAQSTSNFYQASAAARSKKSNSITNIYCNKESISSFVSPSTVQPATSYLNTVEASPFTYIETLSIKKIDQDEREKRVSKSASSARSTPSRIINQEEFMSQQRHSEQRYHERSHQEHHHHHHQVSSSPKILNYDQSELTSKQTPPMVKPRYKTVLVTKLDNSANESTESKQSEFRAFEKEVRGVFEKLNETRTESQQRIEYEGEKIRTNAQIFNKNIQLIKQMRQDYERLDETMRGLEIRICHQDQSLIEDYNRSRLSNDFLIQLRFNLENLLMELQEIENELKKLENESSQLYAHKSSIDQTMLDNREIGSFLDNIDNLVRVRQSNLAGEIRQRRVLLNNLYDSVNLYEQRFRSELKWLNHLNITSTQDNKHHLSNTLTELTSKSNEIDSLNEIGIEFVKLFKKYNKLLNSYNKATFITKTTTRQEGSSTGCEFVEIIINQLRQELNELNKKYANLLREYKQNQRDVNTIHINEPRLVQNLIDKYNKDVFERYHEELDDNDNDDDLTNNQSKFSCQYNYYYENTQPSINQSLNNMSKFPLSFIDAVNKQHIDLESGLFREHSHAEFNLSLGEAIRCNLLNPHTAYLADSSGNGSLTSSARYYDLGEACRLGLITKSNRVLVSSTFTLSFADALKTGHLKIGEPPSNKSLGGVNSGTSSSTVLSTNSNTSLNSNSSSYNSNKSTVSSETQSMSVKTIKDPVSNEYIAPTEAIKRNLLDPYKGLFFNPLTNQHMPISDAIEQGYVVVELIADQPHAKNNKSSSIVSTSLIRETKSYHLLAVIDTTTNQEITIKEAIARGILDRQRGVYINPANKSEILSISDAIQRNFIKARILTPPLLKAQQTGGKLIDEEYQTLVSTNRFEENKTFTIRGALNTRTGQKLLLTQAISEGIINIKEGTFVDLKTNESLSINKAIDLGYVLVERESDKKPRSPSPVKQSPSKKAQPANKEIRTLNIEFIRDARTSRNISVTEAMKLGLFDSQTLTYYNPVTNETLNLNKAYERGFIIGHYTTTRLNATGSEEHKHEEKVQKSYFILDVLDPSTNQVLNLDQAIKVGLFDYKRSVYTHPITGEVFSINEAIQKGFINTADSIDAKRAGAGNTANPIPVGEFGIEKQVKSIRTKFNKDGTSVLQIDIESTKPSKGIFEIDEIEEFTLNQNVANGNQTNNVKLPCSTQRQVVDINTIQHVKPAVPELTAFETIDYNYKHDKETHVQVMEKEIGADLRVTRIEDVIEDEQPRPRPPPPTRPRPVEIIEKPISIKSSSTLTSSGGVLVIDDVNKPVNPVSINGKTNRTKEELHINEESHHHHHQADSTEIRKQFIEIETKKSEILNRVRNQQAQIVIGEEIHHPNRCNHHVVDLGIEKRQIPDRITCDIDDESDRKNTTRREIHIVESFVDNNNNDDEDEESYSEWTEVYTVTIRGIRYKILWVYDTIKAERVTLNEAVQRGLVNLSQNVYHNLKISYSQTIAEAADDGLIGIEEDNSALILNVNGITYTIYWVWDPVKSKRISPKKAIRIGVLDTTNLLYKNYVNNEQITIHEAVYMKLIGASDDLSNIDEELTLCVNGITYKIAWVKDSRTKEKYKPRQALRRGLFNLRNFLYNKYDSNETLTIQEAVDMNLIGLSNVDGGRRGVDDDEDSASTCSSASDLDCSKQNSTNGRQDSIASLDDEELTIRTKTAIYVITGLLHPVTQKEIKVSEAIAQGILNKETGAYRDFKTEVTYEVGEAINEGVVFATVTDLLQDEQASTEFIREEIRRFIVKSVVDPRDGQVIGGLQAQAAGILNYAQGMYTNPESGDQIPIAEAIERKLIEVTLQEESAHEEFDAEVVTDSLMERCTTKYKILEVLDPFSNEPISASEAVRRQIIDTETNAYVDSASSSLTFIPIREAVRRNLIKAEISEKVERKPLGLSLQNAMRLGLFSIESAKFRDPYTSAVMDLNAAIEKGHINPNGPAVADSGGAMSTGGGSMTLNEAFQYSIFNKRTGCLDRQRLQMFKAKLVESTSSKIFKWNFDDAVKCGLINIKTAKYKHQSSGELLSIKDAIQRGLIDGETTIVELDDKLCTLKKVLDEVIKFDDYGHLIDLATQQPIAPTQTLEQMFNTRKIFPAFDENTGEIYLPSLGKIVPFERAIRKNKMDKSVRIFDPRSNKDLVINDALERGIIDKTSGMVIDPKSGGCGGLLSIKEAVKRGIVSVTGAPVVTGHHEAADGGIESAVITSRKLRHHNQHGHFDSVHERRDFHSHRHRHRHQQKNHSEHIDSKVFSKSNPIRPDQDLEFLNSDFVQENPNLIMNNPSVITRIKQSNEEHRRRINDQGEVKQYKISGDFKETLVEPGQAPRVTAKSSYESEIKPSRNGQTYKKT